MIETPEKIELTTSSIYLDSSGILHVVYKNGVEMGFEEAKLHAEACCKLCDGQMSLFLIDARNVSSIMDPSAREHLAQAPGLVEIRKAVAVIVDSLPNRMIANFYHRFNKPKGPLKVFNSEKDALAWLSKYK